MAVLVTTVLERRAARRVAPGATRWSAHALLRPGVPVVLVNISTHGALVESSVRLRPGAHTELQMSEAAARRLVGGRVDRCHVTRLDPLCYRGAIVFDEALDMDGLLVDGEG